MTIAGDSDMGAPAILLISRTAIAFHIFPTIKAPLFHTFRAINTAFFHIFPNPPPQTFLQRIPFPSPKLTATTEIRTSDKLPPKNNPHALPADC